MEWSCKVIMKLVFGQFFNGGKKSIKVQRKKKKIQHNLDLFRLALVRISGSVKINHVTIYRPG